MLRASIAFHGEDGDLRAVTEGGKMADAGIAHGESLTAFAEAAVSREPAALGTARDALRAAAGSAAVVDAAAVIGNFERMVRIADGTGIPLDGVVETLSEDFREKLGLETFQTRRTGAQGRAARLAGPLLRGMASAALRVAGWRSRRSGSSSR